MTFKEAREILKRCDISIKKNYFGEYVVKPKGQKTEYPI